MKIKDGFILRPFGDAYIAVSVSEENPNVAVSLNSVGAFIWQKLEKGLSFENILNDITDTYNVDSEKAKKDLEVCIDILRKAEILE